MEKLKNCCLGIVIKKYNDDDGDDDYDEGDDHGGDGDGADAGTPLCIYVYMIHV